MKYTVKVLNSEGRQTQSRPIDSQTALSFAERIWQANSLVPLVRVWVEDTDGHIYSEWES